MSLFGSLYTGAAGMMAQTLATSTVSQNIANSSTVGYKRSEAFFSDMVTSSERYGTWSGPGSVKAERILRADEQGPIQQTSRDTDLSIAGNGFFIVDRGQLGVSDLVYTRNGSFFEDKDGFLRNDSNMTLYGWTIDQNGNVNQGLTPIQVNLLDTASLPTTEVSLSVNLDSDETRINPYRDTAGLLPVDSIPSHYTRSMSVYDPRSVSDTVNANDIEHNVSFEFRRITGPMANFITDTLSPMTATGNVIDPDGPTPFVNPGESFTLNVGTGGTETYTFVDAATGDDIPNNQIATYGGLIKALKAHGDGTEVTAVIDSNGDLIVQANDPSTTLDLTEDIGSPLSIAGTFNLLPSGGAVPYSYAPLFDINATDFSATPYPDQGDFPPLQNSTTPNAFGWWEMAIMIPDPADPSSTIEERRGLVNFNGDGSLNALADANGQTLIDLSTNPVDFDSAVAGDESAFTIDISKFTQFAGNYNVITASQNGAGPNQRVGIGIDEEGRVHARFANGYRQNLYQIPLATFTNAEGLNDISGTAFEETNESGVPSISAPGTGGAGILSPATLENSSVDIADEFARMIVSQRGYTLNSKVITTIDQMTQRLSEMSK